MPPAPPSSIEIGLLHVEVDMLRDKLYWCSRELAACRDKLVTSERERVAILAKLDAETAALFNVRSELQMEKLKRGADNSSANAVPKASAPTNMNYDADGTSVLLQRKRDYSPTCSPSPKRHKLDTSPSLQFFYPFTPSPSVPASRIWKNTPQPGAEFPAYNQGKDAIGELLQAPVGAHPQRGEWRR
ncbi:hypothetical protein H0H87_003424 [Tephrocybe sp. NHM501043]|nr:hypothetical protein H0H87_003424 [Tephrocybe sp. NHM501043]